MARRMPAGAVQRPPHAAMLPAAFFCFLLFFFSLIRFTTPARRCCRRAPERAYAAQNVIARLIFHWFWPAATAMPATCPALPLFDYSAADIFILTAATLPPLSFRLFSRFSPGANAKPRRHDIHYFACAFHISSSDRLR